MILIEICLKHIYIEKIDDLTENVWIIERSRWFGNSRLMIYIFICDMWSIQYQHGWLLMWIKLQVIWMNTYEVRNDNLRMMNECGCVGRIIVELTN